MTSYSNGNFAEHSQRVGFHLWSLIPFFFFTPELLHVLRNNIQSPPCWLDAGEVPPHIKADVPHAHCLLCNVPSSCRAAHKCERLPEANTCVQPSCRKGLHNHVRKANSCPRRQVLRQTGREAGELAQKSVPGCAGGL